VLLNRLAGLADDRQIGLESSPPRGALRFALAGLALKALGRLDEARASFQQALKLDPGNDRATSELADLVKSPSQKP
jgi:tetratricopeptide (TPR) repeat protein